MNVCDSNLGDRAQLFGKGISGAENRKCIVIS